MTLNFLTMHSAKQRLNFLSDLVMSSKILEYKFLLITKQHSKISMIVMNCYCTTY